MKFFRPEILAMEGYQPGEQPRDGSLIKLNTNENPYPPSPNVLKAIAQAATAGLRRYPDPYADEFRREAAALYQVDPDWILAGNGSDDLLTIITRAFVPRGGLICFPEPSYTLYGTLAKIQGASHVVAGFDRGWDLPDDPAPAETRLFFLPNPNSPSGTVLPINRVRRLAGVLRDRSIPLVIDEAYADFADAHCIELARELDNVLITRTLSKSYSLAGIRFGFAIAQPKLIRELAKVKDSYNCDTVSICAASAALADQTYFQQTVTAVRNSRTRLADALNELGFVVTPSQANFVWCPKSPVPANLLHRQLRDKGILVRYMSYPDYGDGLRISVGTDEEIDKLLSTVSNIVSA